MVLRRDPTAIGSGIAMSPASVRAAATATTLADGLVMLLRRVTRWFALSELDSTECELLRECDCRDEPKLPDDGFTDKDGRWAIGREVGCISCGCEDGVISILWVPFPRKLEAKRYRYNGHGSWGARSTFDEAIARVVQESSKKRKILCKAWLN
jgi:hypothetical protein